MNRTATQASATTDLTRAAPPALQRACACGASKGVEDQCPDCTAKARLGAQPKLTVNRPGDRYEQEADRIADRVVAAGPPGPVAATAPTLQRETAEEEDELQMKPAGVQRMEEEEEEDELQMKTAGPAPAGPAVNQAAAAVSGGGHPLSRTERSYFELRLGRDLSAVRLHDDARAGSAARGINARAYTLKNHIAFAPGTHDFASTEGRRLMAHELAHTAQQESEPGPVIKRDAEASTGSGCGGDPRQMGKIAHQQIQQEWSDLYPGFEPEIPFGAFGNRKEPCAGGRHGFADLWRREGSLVEVGEIKPDTPAEIAKGSLQVQNYIDRSNESVSRLLGSGICGGGEAHPKDRVFDLLSLGGQVQSVGVWPDFQTLHPIRVSEIPIEVGPFDGDPDKALWVINEGDGIVVYWCEDSDDKKKKSRQKPKAAQAAGAPEKEKDDRKSEAERRRESARYLEPPSNGFEIFFPRDGRLPRIGDLPDQPGQEVLFLVPRGFFFEFLSAWNGYRGSSEGPPEIDATSHSLEALYLTLALIGVGSVLLAASLWSGAGELAAAEAIAASRLTAMYAEIAPVIRTSSSIAGPAANTANYANYVGKEAAVAAFLVMGISSGEAKATTLERAIRAFSSSVDIAPVLANEVPAGVRSELGDTLTLSGGAEYVIVAKGIY